MQRLAMAAQRLQITFHDRKIKALSLAEPHKTLELSLITATRYQKRPKFHIHKPN